MVKIKISGRNQLSGVISGVEVDGLMARVMVDTGNDNHITSVITKESYDQMKLAEGDRVKALIKSTSVMITK